MASEGASGEHPPPVQTLAAAVLGSVDTVRPPERCPGTPENGRGSRPSCGQRVRWVVEGGCRNAHRTDSGSWSNSGGQRREARGFVIVLGGGLMAPAEL